MSNKAPLKKIRADVPREEREAGNVLKTPSREKIQEAVREANDPRRLVSDAPPRVLENCLQRRF